MQEPLRFFFKLLSQSKVATLASGGITETRHDSAVADVQQPIIGADFLIHYNLLVDLRRRCLRDMRTGLAIAASLSSIKPLSLNKVDTVQNEYTKLLGQFPELTRPTTKGETVKHGITHKTLLL